MCKVRGEIGMNEEQTTQEPAEKPEKWSSWQNPVLTPEQWGEVRRAVEAGMTSMEAGERWKVDPAAVRKRAQREQWITTARIKILAEKVAEKEAAKVAEANESQQVTRPANALSAVAESMEGYKSRTMLSLLKLAEKGVSRAVSADLPVENWQDAKIAAEIAMKLHQVGQESVQVNICNAFADMGEGSVIETETEIVSEDEGEDGGRDAYFVD